MGSVLFAGGMLDEAAAYLTEAIRLDPNHADAHFNMGQVRLRRKQFDSAIGHLSRAVELKPSDAQAHYTLALALAQNKQAPLAATHYARAISLEPGVDTSPLLNHLLAMHYAEVRRFDQAIAAEEKALELARAAGYQKLSVEFEKWLEAYRKMSN